MRWNQEENVTEILGQPKTSLAPQRKMPHPAVLSGVGHSDVRRKLLLGARRPAHTERYSGMVVFALDWVFRTALIKSENLVAQVKSVSKKAESLVEAITSLHVELRMRAQINVAGRTFQAQNGIVRRSVGLVRILKQVGVIMVNREPSGKSRLVVG